MFLVGRSLRREKERKKKKILVGTRKTAKRGQQTWQVRETRGQRGRGVKLATPEPRHPARPPHQAASHTRPTNTTTRYQFTRPTHGEGVRGDTLLFSCLRVYINAGVCLAMASTLCSIYFLFLFLCMFFCFCWFLIVTFSMTRVTHLLWGSKKHGMALTVRVVSL